MYISRIQLRPNRASVPALVRLGGDEGYRVHQQLWRLFQGKKQRDFLYRRENLSPLPAFITVSDREPSDPEGLWALDIKDYSPKLTAGTRLGFALTANPVVTRKDDTGRSHRHDVVMDAKQRRQATAQSEAKTDAVRDAGLSWLSRKAESNGFAFEPTAVLVDGYRQHRLAKAGAGQIRFSTLDFSGVLTVTDADRFVQSLYKGIGPAKAFGCGLLLVRRLS